MKQGLHPLVMIGLVAAVDAVRPRAPDLDTVARDHRRLQCPDRARHRGAGAHRQRVVRPGPVLRGGWLWRGADRQRLGHHRRGGAGDHRRRLRRSARPRDRPADCPLQRHLLRHADAGAVDGVLWRAGQIDRARRLGRLQCRAAEPVRHGLHRSARGGFHAVCRLGCHDRACRHRRDHPVPVRARPCQPRGSRKQFARRVSRHLGQPGRHRSTSSSPRFLPAPAARLP